MKRYQVTTVRGNQHEPNLPTFHITAHDESEALAKFITIFNLLDTTAYRFQIDEIDEIDETLVPKTEEISA